MPPINPTCVAFQFHSGLAGYICAARTVIGYLIPIAFGLAVVFFFYGMLKFMMASGDEKALAEGRQVMLWGIIAIFIGVSVWGIVALFSQIFLGTPGTGVGVGGGILPVQP